MSVFISSADTDTDEPRKPIRTLNDLQIAVSNSIHYDSDKGEYIRDDDFIEEVEQEFIEHVNKLQNVSAVYSKADTVITGDNVMVRVDSTGEMTSPAHNDGREITLNASLLETIDDTTITSLHGFNYHEVAHVLFSPRRGSKLGKFIEENNMRRAYNILEDSRIERLLIAKYPSTRLYLEACITDYLLKGDPATWKDYFHLVTGRKYLDLEVRQALADRFIAHYGLGVAEDISRIVHTYRELVFPTDFDKAIELITQMTKYVGQDDTPPVFPEGGQGHSDRPVGDKGRPDSGAEQKKLQERSEQMERGSGSEELGEQQKQAEREGDIQNPEAHNPSEQDKQLRDKLNKRHETLIKNEQVKGGTAEIRNAIDFNPDSGSSIRPCHYQDQRVDKVSLEVAERFAHELEQLRIENDPAWQLEQPIGRLNVARTIHADINDIDRLFDKWHTGNDNRDIEAIILLDNSGSMGYQMASALTATWTIKRALEAIDSRVTVFRFNSDGRLLYSAEDKASPNTYRYIGSTGSTNPYEVLVESERMLSASDRGIKLFITVSDGGWENSVMCDEVVSRINNIEGAITVSVLLGNFSYYYREYGAKYVEDELIPQYRHNAQVFHAISEPKDLVEVASKIVTSAMTPTH